MANQTNDYTSHQTQNNKIKRTVEHILTWLGVALQALIAIMFLVLKPLMSNDSFKDQMVRESQNQGNTLSAYEMNQGFDALGSFFSFLTWGAVITLVLAIIGGILISKKPKIAGILLIIAALVAIMSNWISAILWIVAGIMLLVRKGKKKDTYDNGYYNNNNRNHDYDNRHDDKAVNAENNAFILDEEDKAKEQSAIKEHYSNDDVHHDRQQQSHDDVHNGSHQHLNHSDDNNRYVNTRHDSEHNVDHDRDEHNNHTQYSSRSDRYQDEAHKDVSDFEQSQHNHKDQDFVREEADKLKDKKDNDPYKY
ncbi:DUF4064 domain-containing protein [Staphylococcus borealis]|uniref:DUF4064 domain-containing protein n=1 Tax=Staphylococcus borealis TaxID=2742203 RepID=A0ABX2LH18_9STAP|nr:DUF4064 domain-containing protein [Staphylococcus borealis]MUN93812.1 DUF4064 domain-containing protein [Staphylococcus borealis]NUI79085.1 DUF4064 domain-containing protein [Staphylococcus borealis]NUI81596.1 DUF4064 domain-containing protein [Staphylococcus borealis]NUI83928.1 DUF4064 domain-containing protein [Staphylococcus borealis]NUI91011.1 DUF4064 domain-containing protein [Staphylococcus borealis]